MNTTQTFNGAKRLTSISSIPYALPTGRIVAEPGWSADSGIYLHVPLDYSSNIPTKVTRDQLEAAVVRMMRPFRGYQCTSADGTAALISAVLTAVFRPALVKAPAIGIDAASQSSGKTLLAETLAALTAGSRVGVTPWAGDDSEEMSKRLLAGVLAGMSALILDNVIGHVKAPALAAYLTSGRISGRVLGASRNVDAEVRALVLLAGNQLSLSADLQRRVMMIRIDGGSNPIARRFDHNPVDDALTDRMGIAEAACTIIQAYSEAGSPRLASDDAGGFTEFVKLCRQPVLWLAREGITDVLGWGPVGDPAASMLANVEQADPEIEMHGDLLQALWLLSGGDPFTARQVVEWWSSGEQGAHDEADVMLREVIDEILNRPRKAFDSPSARTVGRLLLNRRDRVVRSMRLVGRLDASAGSRSWRIQRLDPG